MKKSMKILTASFLLGLFGVFSIQLIRDHDYIEKIPTKYLLNGNLDNESRDKEGSTDEQYFDYYKISNTSSDYNGKYAIGLKDGVTETSFTIPGKYNNQDVIGIYRFGFANKSDITVQIPSTIQVIDYEAFFCTTFSASSETLNIPYSVKEIGTAAFFKTNITTLNFFDTDNPSSLDACPTTDTEEEDDTTKEATSSQLTAIPDFCFAKCTNLESITFSNSLTTIKEEAFEYCKSLSTVAFLGGLQNIGERAFNACSSLSKVYLPSSLFARNSDNTQFVGGIGDFAFANCNSKLAFQASTTDTVYASFKTEFDFWNRKSDFVSGTYYDKPTCKEGDVYANGTWLYELSDSKIKLIKYIGNITDGIMAFPDTIDTAGQAHKVTAIASDCISEYASQITKLYFPKYLTDIPDNFFNDDYSSITYIGCMSGKNCYNSTTITNAIDLSEMDDLTTIGDSAFNVKNKKNFTTLKLPGGLTSIGKTAFNEYIYVTDFSIKQRDTDDDLHISTKAFENLGSKISRCAKNDIVLPKGTTSIGEKAFNSALCIRSLTIKGYSKASDKANNLTINSQAFLDCENLQKVIIEDRLGTSGYKSITLSGKCFANNEDNNMVDYSHSPLLQTVYLPNGVCSSSKDKKDQFNGQYRAVIYYGGLSTLDLGDSLVLKEITQSKSGTYIYANKEDATKFNFNCEIPTYTGVTLFDYATDDSALILYDEEEFTYLLTQNTNGNTAAITKYHFNGKNESGNETSKKSVTVSDTLTAIINNTSKSFTVNEIGKYAFAHSDSVTRTENKNSITLSDDVYTISSVSLPDSIKEIGDYAFFRCVGLEGEFAMPSSLQSIGYLAFAFTGISSIKDLNSYCSFILGDDSIQSDYSKPSPFLNCPNLSSITLKSKESSTLALSTNASALLDTNNNVWVFFPAYTNTDSTKTTYSFSSGEKFHFGAFKTVGWIGELAISGSNYPMENNTVIPQTLFTGYCNQTQIRQYLAMGQLVSGLADKASPLQTKNDTSMVLKLQLDSDGNLTIPEGAFLKSNITTIRIPYGGKDGSNHKIPAYFLNGINVPNDGLILQVETNVEGTAWTNNGENPKKNYLDFTNTAYTTIEEHAFYQSSFLNEVNLGSVETVGEYAFYQNTNLTKVTFTNVQRIGTSAFEYDTKLTEIDCPKAITIGSSAFLKNSSLTKANCPEATTIGDMAFQSCMILSDMTMSKVVTLGNSAFRSDSALKTIVLPETLTTIGSDCFHDSGITNTKNKTGLIIPKSVVTIGNSAFRNCDNLVSVVFESGGELTTIPQNCFDNCDNLSSVVFPEKLTTISDVAFWGCAFTELEFPSTLQSIGKQAFDHYWGNANRTKLKSIVFKGSTNKLIIGQEAFRDSQSLTSITFETSTADLEIGSNAFEGCIALPTLTLPDRGTITLQSSAFTGCSKLNTVTIENSANNIIIGTYCFNNCTSLKILILGDRPEIHLYQYAFNGCSSLSKIETKESTGDLHIYQYCFSKCTGLKTLTLENRKKISVSDNAFEYCTGLTTLIINDVDVKFWNNVFAGCTSLSTVTINESKTNTPVYFYTGVFASCPITTLDFSKRPIWLGKLVNMNAAANVVDSNCISWGQGKIFQGCTSLTSVTFGDFEYGNYIGAGVFSGCTSLTTVTFGKSITNIGKDAFKSTKLTSVDLSQCTNASFTTLNGFSNCSLLTSFIYPSQITAIGESCFSGSTALTTVKLSTDNEDGVYLSSSITSIGESAFSGCTSMTIVKSKCTDTLTLGNSVFSGCTSLTLFSQDTSGSFVYGTNIFSGDTSLKAIVLPSNFNMDSTNQLVGGLTFFSSTGSSYICFANGKSYYAVTGDAPGWMYIDSNYKVRIAYYTGNGKKDDGSYATDAYEWEWNTDETMVVVTAKGSTQSSTSLQFSFSPKRKEERLSF